MEVKINKEIRDYSENVYFGLNLRQFIFSLIACFIAIMVYFIFKPYFGTETLSWLCIISAAPFAAIGFVKYNGMNAEEFLKAYIRSEFLCKRQLGINNYNFYDSLLNNKVKGDKKDENN